MPPLRDRLRDCLGAVRCLRSHPDAAPARAALDAAEQALLAAADPLQLPAARAALEAAAFALPWASSVLWAARAWLGEAEQNGPLPPFFSR